MEPHPNTIKMQQINRKDRLIFNTMIDRRKTKNKKTSLSHKTKLS